MAKRKKLNTRVVVLLSVFGVLILALAVAAVIRYMPRDPEAYYDRGMAAFENGEYDSGQRFLSEAIRQSKRQGQEKPEYYYQLARLQREWAEEKTELSGVRRRELVGHSYANLDTALQADSSYMPAHRMLCELSWESARATGGTGRHWDEFIDRINALIEQEPDNPDSFYKRAVAKSHQSAVKGEYYDEALRDYRRAIELKGDEPDYWIGMIRMLVERNRLVEADTAFAEALEANPDSSRLRSFYSEYLARRGRQEEALAQLQEAIERNPDSAQPFLSLAVHYERSGNRQAAMQALEQAKQAEPDSWDANNAMASIYDRMGKVESAVEEFREGLAKLSAELDRMKAEEMSLGERIAAENRITMARVHMNRGLGLLLTRLAEQSDDAEQAEEYLRQAQQHAEAIGQIAPDSPYAAEILGRIAEQKGDFGKAIERLQKAYEHYGTRNPRLAIDLMQLYLRRGMPGRAEQILDRLLKTPGLTSNTGLLLTKAQLEMQYRRFNQAEGILEGILRSNPENEHARSLLATLRARTSGGAAMLPEGDLSPQLIMAMRQQASAAWVAGDRDEAVRILEDLHERAPEDWGVSSQLTSVYVGMEQKEKAREVMERAREYHSDRPQVDYALRMLEETDPEKRFELAMEATAVEEDPAQRELSKAAVCAVFGRTEQYAEHLKKAMELDPDSPEVVGRMFQYALSREDWELAEQCIEAAEKANLDELNGRIYRAQMAAIRGRYEEVVELLEEPLKSRPDLKRAWLLLASSYLRVGRIQDARETYDELRKIDPFFAPAVIGLAAVSERLGDEEQHRRWIERANELAPDDPYVRSRYLNLQEEQGDPYQAIRQRETILQREPDDTANIYRLAMLYERTGQLDKAERMFSRYGEQADESLEGAAVMAAFYERTRQYSRIDDLIGRLLNIESDKVGVYQLWGQLLQARNPAQAEQAFLQAVREDPQDPRGHWSLASFYSQLNRPAQALEHFRKCVELRPDNVRYRKGLLGQLINAGQYDEASRRLDEYRRENPEDIEAMTFAGILALRQGDVDRARELLDEAVARSPDSPDPLQYRAQLKAAQGRFEEAVEDIKRAQSISDSAEVGVQLADYLVRIDEYDEAERALRGVISRYRGYAPAINRLIGIYQSAQRWNRLEEFLKEIRAQFPNAPNYLIREAEMWSARGSADREVDALAKAYNLAPDSVLVVARYTSALLKNRQYQRVLEVSEQFMQEGDPPVWILAVRGRAFAGLGREEQAEQSFAQAVEAMTLDELQTVGSQVRLAYGREEAIDKLSQWQGLHADDSLIHILLAQLHQEAREHERAIELLTQAERLAQTDREVVEINKRLGPSYQATGQVSSAEDAYLTVLKHDSDREDPYVLNNLAYLYVDLLDEPEKALPYAEKAAAMLPENAAVLDTYGWALFKVGRTTEAETQLLRAVQLGQVGATVRYHLGVVYEQSGRNREALQQYRRAYDMVRNDEGHELHAELKEAVSRVEDKLSG